MNRINFRGAFAWLSKEQETLNQRIGKEEHLEPKEQERSDVKKQSPPPAANLLVLDVKVGNPLTKQLKGDEIEIEIWLEDDQNQSIDSLITVVEQALASTSGSSNQMSLPLKDDSYHNNPELPQTYELRSPPFVVPIKKSGCILPLENEPSLQSVIYNFRLTIR